MIVKIKLDKGAYYPTRAYPDDAGLDLYTKESITIRKGESALFDTGIHIELPPNTFAKIESKSGLMTKYKIISLGGVIDRGYTGPIKVCLFNLSKETYTLKKGVKIAQLIIHNIIIPDIEIVDTLDESLRGNNGFGSTGV